MIHWFPSRWSAAPGALGLLAVLAPAVGAQQAKAVRLEGDAPVVDGRLADPAWQAAPPITDFRQKVPTEGAPASEDTEVRFLYTEHELYVGIRARDRGRVFGPLVRRDQSVNSDYVHVYLDTYHDRRTAYQFTINPAGSRRDVFIYDDGARRDDTWDPVYDWAARVDPEGWSAELRIPFSQLRFPHAESVVFGLRVSREIQRLNEESNWPFVPQDQAGEVSNYAELTGLDDLAAPRRIELLPYTAGSRALAPTVAFDPLSGPRSEMRTGGDLKLGLTSGLTMDLTINPDFGQVEADPAVVNLSGFENFFSERRPFFVEGTDLLRFTFGSGSGGDEGLVYTRRVGRSPQVSPSAGANFADVPVETTILGAAKVTGRLGGGWAVGAAQALTAKERAQILTASGARVSDAVVEPFSSYSVLRLQRTTQRGRLTYGGMATGMLRHFDDPVFAPLLHRNAYSGGLDLRGRLSDAYEYEAKVLGTRVQGTPEAILRTQRSAAHYFQRPGQTYLRVDSTRTVLTGFAANVRFAKVTGFAVFAATYSTRTPGLETNDAGFLRRADQHSGSANLHLRWLRPGKIFRRFEIELRQSASSTYGGELGNTTTEVRVDGTFLTYWRFNQNAEWEPAHVDPRALRGGAAIDVPAHYHFNGGINSDSRRALTSSLSWNTTLEEQSGRRELTLNSGLNWRPPGPVSLSVSARRNWLWDDRQYLTSGTVNGVAQYVLGRMKRREISITVRSDISVSPRLSLQLYAQPFASGRTFDELRLVTSPRSAGGYLSQFDVIGLDRLTRAGDGSTVTVDVDRDGTSDLSFSEPDRKVVSLRTNAVLRWEFRAGSTLYLVWNQNRSGETYDGTLHMLDDLGDAFGATGGHVLALKIAYWIGL